MATAAGQKFFIEAEPYALEFDPAATALACRKLLALDFDTMLVGDGHSIVGGAREHLLRCLEARTDIYINRIKAGDVPWTSRRDRSTTRPRSTWVIRTRYFLLTTRKQSISQGLGPGSSITRCFPSAPI